MSNLSTLILIAMVAVCCSAHLVRDSKDLMKKRHCTWLGCHPYLLSRQRWTRSIAEEKPKTQVIYSDLPEEKILEEVKSQYISYNEEAVVVQDENQDVDNIRHKRGVRAIIIRVCNRRTGQCRVIIVYRKY